MSIKPGDYVIFSTELGEGIGYVAEVKKINELSSTYIAIELLERLDSIIYEWSSTILNINTKHVSKYTDYYIIDRMDNVLKLEI